MDLKSLRELETTRMKLAGLKNAYKFCNPRPAATTNFVKILMESLVRTINQLKEEIARFEARHSVKR